MYLGTTISKWLRNLLNTRNQSQYLNYGCWGQRICRFSHHIIHRMKECGYNVYHFLGVSQELRKTDIKQRCAKKPLNDNKILNSKMRFLSFIFIIIDYFLTIRIQNGMAAKEISIEWFLVDFFILKRTLYMCTS